MTFEQYYALWRLEQLSVEVAASSDDAETLWRGLLKVRDLDQEISHLFCFNHGYHNRRGEALQRVFKKFKLAQRTEAGMATWRRRVAIEKARVV